MIVLLSLAFYKQSKITTMFHNDIINVSSVFSPLFSIKVWSYALTLLTGAILCDNQRTIAAILRVMGLSKSISSTIILSLTVHAGLDYKLLKSFRA